MLSLLFIFIFDTASAKSELIDSGLGLIFREINQQKLVQVDQKMCFQNFVLPESMSMYQYDKAIFNDCMVSICGMPSENPSVWLTNDNFEKLISADSKKKVDKLIPTIEKVFAKTLQLNINELEQIRALPDKVSFNSLSDYGKSALSKNLFDKYLEVKIDLTKPVPDRVQVIKKLPSDASEDMFLAINDYAKNYKNVLLADFKNDENKNVYSDTELVEISRNKFSSFRDFFNQNKAYFDKAEYQEILLHLDFVKNKLNVSSQESVDVRSIFVSLDHLQKKISKYSKDLDVAGVDRFCKTQNCLSYYKKYIESLKLNEKIDKLQSALNDEKLKNMAINECRAALLSDMIESSSFFSSRRVFSEAKEAIKKNVLTKFSPASAKMIGDYISNDLDYTSKNPLKIVRSNDTILDFEKEALQYISNSNVNNNLPVDFSLIRAMKLAKEFEAIDMYSDSSSPCHKSAVNAWDAYLPSAQLSSKGNLPKAFKSFRGSDVIFISDFSCTHEHRGKGVVAHEIGHAISSMFLSSNVSLHSSEKYRELRKCVTDKYIDAPESYGFQKHLGDKLYTEEDVADAIAAMALARSGKPYTCSLLKPMRDLQGYSDLFFQLNGNDPHSTSFNRVISEVVNRGESLPLSCQHLIQKENNLRFSPCR